VHAGRKVEMDPRKEAYARETDARTLGEVIAGADVFLGLSAPRVLKPEMVARMAPRPVVLALANPTPEIMPEEVRAVRPDAIIATGRSDYPNQVNNVLCFPFIFRGALDVGATAINEAMKVAAVRAIADLATKAADEQVAAAYGGEPPAFGPENLIPRPFDPRLIFEIAPAVARAAMDSGVATRPIADFDAYRQRLSEFVYRSGFLMRPIFERAKQKPMRIVYADGEDERVLRAAQTVVDERLARPILVGRRETIRKRIERLGLRLRLDEDVELRNPEDLPHYQRDWTWYHRRLGRKGVSVDGARTIVRTRNVVIAALMVAQGEADGMICGLIGRWHRALQDVIDVVGLQPGVATPAAITALIMPRGTIFVCDTHVQPDPSAADIAAMTVRGADTMRRFGLRARAALLSHSTYGSFDTDSSLKMREALAHARALAPDLEIDGEMSAEAAFEEEVRLKAFQDSTLRGEANLLVMPTLDAAHIAFGLLRELGGGQKVGPMLLGMAAPVHVLDNSSTVRSVVNMTALCAVEAQDRAAAGAARV
jgi:malate dehydrogenase (oxaloacetate-decarboxylating)(NADP+)